MSDTATVAAPQASAPAPTTNTEVKTAAAVEPKEVKATGGKVPAVKPEEGKKEGEKAEGSLKEGEIKKESNPDDPEKPFKIKVDGKEYSLTKEEATRWAQKGIGVDRKLSEARKKVEVAETFIRLLRENPEAVLMNPQIMGQERFQKLAQDYLHKQIQKEMMTPEQRELAELKEKLAMEEAAKKELEEKTSTERMNQLTQHFNQQYEKDISDTLATSGLPKTRFTVKRIAYYLSEGLKKGVELKASDVIEIVRDDYKKEHQDLYGQLDGDTLVQFLGDENIKKIREAELKKLNPATGRPVIKPSAPVSDEPSKKMTPEEWRAHQKKRFGL